ncbi:MAG: hypothetical protein AAF430_08760 [Myxococcota bacterium]
MTLGLGYDWSRGDYDARPSRTTEIQFATLSLAYLSPELPLTKGAHDWLEIRATLPVVEVSGPGSVDRVGSFVGGAPRNTERQRGLGDVVLRGSYFVAAPRESWLPNVDVSAQVKFPTADASRGLGTGRTDVTVELGVSRRFGPFTPFGSIGRRFMGEPRFVRLVDRWLASGGVSWRLHEALTVGVLYDWRHAAQPGNEHANEIVAFSWWRARPGLRFGPYAVAGLTEGSPDYALGAQLRLDWNP